MTKLGALIGLALGVGWGLILIETLPGGTGWGLLGALIGLVTILYIIANTIVGSAADPAASAGGDVMRYLLVAMNGGLNLVFASKIYSSILGDAAGITLGIALTLLNLVAVFQTISTSEVYQGFLGWANWFLPMSWVVMALGLTLWILGLLGHLFLYLIARVRFFQVEGMRVDWKTGTIFTRGGFVSNLNPIDTAFNMGAFAYVDYKDPKWHIEHEAGHTLNLAAFGWIFHFIGAIDENVTGGREKAFSERLAESNDPDSELTAIIIPMWV